MASLLEIVALEEGEGGCEKKGGEGNEEGEQREDFELKLADARHDLGAVSRLQGDYSLSCQSLLLSIKIKSDILGDHSSSVAESLSSLSLTKKLMGDDEESTALNRKAMRIYHDTDTSRSREGGWWD